MSIVLFISEVDGPTTLSNINLATFTTDPVYARFIIPKHTNLPLYYSTSVHCLHLWRCTPGIYKRSGITPVCICCSSCSYYFLHHLPFKYCLIKHHAMKIQHGITPHFLNFTTRCKHQLHSPATLHPGKELVVSTEKEAR